MRHLFNKDFLEYLKFLNVHSVQYVLVGGMAVNIHGYRRSTGDMDLFVKKSTHNSPSSANWDCICILFKEHLK